MANVCLREMKRGFHARKQGDIGEVEAVATLTRAGAFVSVPVAHSPDYDLIADFGHGLIRVQVKTSSYRASANFSVQLATSGGNQTWTGLVKRFDRNRYDALFVLVADGRRWFIPSSAIDAQRAITVGGPKYSEYEISHEATPVFASVEGPLECPAPRGSADVGESGEPVKFVPLAEWVRIPPPPFDPPTSPSTTSGLRLVDVGRTRISTGHQLTIPSHQFRVAELGVGDRLEVIPEAPGRVLLNRVHTAPVQQPLTTPAATAPAAGA